MVHLDPFDDGPYDFPPRFPVGLLETILDAPRKFLHPVEDKSDLSLLSLFLLGRPDLRLQTLKAFPCLPQPGFEFALLEEAFTVSVYQSCDRALHLSSKCFDLLKLLCADSGFVFSPAIELRMNSVRIFKERPHVAPHRVFEKVRADFLVAAKPIAVEAMGIAPDAAVVRITPSLSVCGGTARALPVESVAALDADNEPLEEMGCSAAAFPRHLPVLRELVLDALE